MEENKDWKKQLAELARNPATWLALALVLGVGANIAFLSLKVLPLTKEKLALSSQAGDSEAQTRIQERRPIPAKVDAAAFTPLLKQVPVSNEMPDFLLQLHDAETKSGVVLSNLSLAGADGASKEEDLLSSLLKTPAPAGGTAPAPKPSPSPAANAAAKKNSATSTFSTNTLTLQLNGTYTQIRDFMTKLYQLERVVNIRQWQYTANGSAPSTPTPVSGKGTPSGGTAQQPQVQMTMTLDIYIANAYAGKLQDPPSAIQPSPGLRDDPTMLDEQFQQLLDSLSTKAVR